MPGRHSAGGFRSPNQLLAAVAAKGHALRDTAVRQVADGKRVRDSYGATRSVFFFVPLFWVLMYTQIRRPTMPDSLPALEAERSQILRQLSILGDLRPGSIGAVARRCGKPTCHCAKPKDPGPAASYLCRTAQGRRVGRRGRGVGVSNDAPLRWGSGSDPTPPSTGTDSDDGALRLRPPGSL